jgi:hypothetical protein
MMMYLCIHINIYISHIYINTCIGKENILQFLDEAKTRFADKRIYTCVYTYINVYTYFRVRTSSMYVNAYVYIGKVDLKSTLYGF